MILHRLKLKNFISHRDTEIVFPQGLTTIIGDNGAGKTALLDAISYVLYKEHSRGADENVVNRRADSAEVSLVFSVGGREYSVDWKISKRRSPMAVATIRDRTTGKLILDSIGERSAVRELEKLLGVPKEVFMNAIYVRQGEIARLLEMRPAERKRAIGELLGIGLLEDLWKSLSSPISRLEERREWFEREAQREKELEESLRELNAKVADVKDELGSLESSLSELEDKKAKVEEEFEELDKRRRTVEKLKAKREALMRKVTIKEAELDIAKRDLERISYATARLEELKLYEEQYEELSGELEDLQEELERLTREVSRLRAVEDALKRAEREAKITEQEIEEHVSSLSELSGKHVSEDTFADIRITLKKVLEKERSEVLEELAKIDREIGEQESMIKHNDELARTLREAGDRCPLCNQKLTPEHKDSLLEQIREETKRAREEVEKLQRKREGLIEMQENIEERWAKLLSLDPVRFMELIAKLRERMEEIRKLKSELSGLKGSEDQLSEVSRKRGEVRKRFEELKPLHDEFLKLRGLIDEVGRPEELKAKAHRIESELRELRDELKLIDEGLRRIGFDESSYNKALQELRELSYEIREASNAVERLKKEKEHLERELALREQELKRVKEAKTKAEKLKSEVELLKRIREAFGKDGMQREVRKVAKQHIESYARKFLQALNIEYSDLRLDDDYNVYLYGPDGEQSIDAISGGEKVAVALALRLAIAATLAGDRLECIVMDEPTIHLDQEKRRGLVKLLENFRKERGILPQAIVVTHDREVEEISDQVYEVFKRGGSSVVELAGGVFSG